MRSQLFPLQFPPFSSLLLLYIQSFFVLHSVWPHVLVTVRA